MRKCFKIVLVFIWVILSIGSFAQNSNKQLVVFSDRNSCLSGDTVWFKVWIPIGLEKHGNVVHVQLDSDNGNLIASVAVKSKSGFAEGYIPVPDSLSTGIYYLSSFLNAQRAEAQISSTGKLLYVYNRFAENINQMPVPGAATFVQFSNETVDIKINLSETSFAYRDKVEGTVLVSENISFAVVKAKIVDPFANENSGFVEFSLSGANSSIPVFAENNGVLLNGKISENGTSPNSSELVLLSITGEPPYLDYYYSQPSGDLHFFLKDAVGNANVILQVVGTNDKDYTIRPELNALKRSNPIELDTVFLKPAQYEFIENSLKNSFFARLFNPLALSGKPFFNMPTPFGIPFYGPPTRRIVPDEFFDLPDFKEITRELIHGVQYRTRNDEITFRMLNLDRGNFFDNEPLRLLNGIPVFKNSFFTGLKSTDIKYIDVVQSERVFGDLYFKGVLAVLLNDRSNSWLAQQPNIFQFNIPCLQADRKAAYGKAPETNATVPDVRQNFLWEVVEQGATNNFSFYLSDLKGTVEISVEGVTQENQVFKSSKTIEVK